MTAGEIVDNVQLMLNDPSGEYFTDALVLAAVNRVNREISRTTRYLGLLEGTITVQAATYTYPLPSVTGVGVLYDLAEDPIYDGTTPILRTTQEHLSRIDPLWRTRSTSGAPTHVVMSYPATPPGMDTQMYVRFYPGPTDVGKTITCVGHAIAAGLGADASPMLPVEYQPVLIYGAAIELLTMVGESSSAEKIAFLKPQYDKLYKMIISESGNAEVPRLIRGLYSPDVPADVMGKPTIVVRQG